ncbi:MAG: YbjN domain-containing protein [Magnetospirillum sp.]|nr:YbjN domain-containing protein [Magnetospirillum sp.]
MSISLVYEDEPVPNPLDLVEQIVTANDWAFDRRSDEELAVEVPGKWCNYSLYFAWREDMGAMHFTCAFDMKVPGPKRLVICELLAMVNEKLWLGHFGLWEEEGAPMFRHTSLLRGAIGFTHEQVEDLVDIAVSECERFYPAFQFVIWGGKSAREAVAASLLETVGEA